MSKIAIYAGTFDPLTNGHVDIVLRASTIFDRVIMGIAQSTRKTPCIPLHDRVQLCQNMFLDNPKIEVDIIEDLALDFAYKHKAAYFIRGLRSMGDFDYEMQMAAMNRKMAPEIDTVFLPASSDQAFISATMVREIISLGRDVSNFVPQPVVEYFKRKNGLKNN